MQGVDHSDCPLPCMTTSTSVRRTAFSKQTDYNSTSVYLIFNTEVATTEVTLDRFEFVESLNFLGSYLGLWPGMGLFQVSCDWWRTGHVTILLPSDWPVQATGGSGGYRGRLQTGCKDPASIRFMEKTVVKERMLKSNKYGCKIYLIFYYQYRHKL